MFFDRVATNVLIKYRKGCVVFETYLPGSRFILKAKKKSTNVIVNNSVNICYLGVSVINF